MPAQPWPPTEPTEVRISAGDAVLAVNLRGGGMRRLAVGDWELLHGYPEGAVVGGWPGGVLLPWPNRIRNGRWSWQGRELQLPVSSPEVPTANHGLVGWQRWTVLDEATSTVSVGTTVEGHTGYPFRLAAAVDDALAADGLRVTARVRNVGAEPAPFGMGFHPYFSVGATDDGDVGQAELTLPARTALVLDAGLPTGDRARFDGAVGRIDERAIDVALTDLDRDDQGWARATLRGPAGQLEAAVDEAWPWLQAYTGDTLPPGRRRRSVALEPMTCPPNALADGVDVLVLEPEGEWAGTWTLSWTAG